MEWKKNPAVTQQAWLEELGRRLAWTFPAAQVKDILSDYQEQFDAGHDRCKTEAEIIEGLGTPAEAVALLLEEEPAARTGGLRQTFLWGAALAVCLYLGWICFASYTFGLFLTGSVLLLPVTASVLFPLIRGPARVTLEKLTEKRVSRVAVYYVPAALVLVSVAERLGVLLFSDHLVSQYTGGRLTEDSFEEAARVLRYGNGLALIALMLVLSLLTVWMLYRCAKSSIRYFPGIIHIFGALEAVFFSMSGYISARVYETSLSIYLGIPISLLPYFSGLLTALAFQRWVDGRKPLPHLFQSGPVTWQDWRHRLGVSLLGWFPVEQTLEILDDYQEQYELGREQGKDEDILLQEMGRPETVVRDLLVEDRKARLHRRKTWGWTALAAVAGWLLLGLLRTFEFGNAGFGWFYHQKALLVGLLSTVLGTVALFFLLHARERAAVERRFPTPLRPTVWTYLLPLVCSAVVECLALWCVRDSLDYRTPVFLGLPLTWFVTLAIEFSSLLLTMLLIWTLVRCVSGSIRYLSAAPCIAGSLAQLLCAGIILSSMDMEALSGDISRSVDAILTALLPCLAGLVLAVFCWLVLRIDGKKEG